MSSSDTKIIKDAKLSANPVIIAMHDFNELTVEDDPSVEMSDATDHEGGVLQEQKSADASRMENEMLVKQAELLNIAKDEADELLRQARQQADSLRAQVIQEASQLKEAAKDEGKKQGYDQGFKQGLAEAKAQMSSQLTQTSERCNTMLQSAETEYRRIIGEAEPQIVELSLAICRKIIAEEIKERPGTILSLVRDALQRVRDQNQINIHVSPDDYEYILAARRELQSIVGAEQSLTITADPVLNKGGCLIETSFGTVEAGVDTQLDSVRKVLQGMLP